MRAPCRGHIWWGLRRVISELPIIPRMIRLWSHLQIGCGHIYSHKRPVTSICWHQWQLAIITDFFRFVGTFWHFQICLTLVRFAWRCQTWPLLWAVWSSPLKLCGERLDTFSEPVNFKTSKNCSFLKKAPAGHRINGNEKGQPGKADEDTRWEEGEIDVVTNLR